MGTVLFHLQRGLPCYASCDRCHEQHELIVDDNMPAEILDALTAPLSKDGYRPLTPCLMWGPLDCVASVETHTAQNRYVWLAARRLDTAHRLLERAREEMEHAARSDGRPEFVWAALGDVELALVAMHLAFKMARDIARRWPHVSTEFPQAVEQKLPELKKIRDSLEHGDERALGSTRGKRDEQAILTSLNLFNLFMPDMLRMLPRPPEDGAILVRKYVYEDASLNLDEEATRLLRSVRDYLASAWEETRSVHIPR